MLLQAVNSGRGSVPSTQKSATSSSLLLTENQQSIGGPPALMEKLTLREREIVLKQGRRKVLNRGQTLFSQGAKHDGIWLIESGRVRVSHPGTSSSARATNPPTRSGRDLATAWSRRGVVRPRSRA